MMNGKEPTESFDVETIFPLLEYLIDTKAYAIKNLIEEDLDDLEAAIIEVFQDFLKGEVKARNTQKKASKILKEDGYVTYGLFNSVLKNRPNLMQKLSANGDTKNVTERVSRLIGLMVKNGTLLEKKYGKHSAWCLAAE